MKYDYVTEAGKTVSFDTLSSSKLKRYEITLANRCGEIDRQMIDVPDNTEPWQLTHYVCEAIKCWALRDGDVIAIREG
jgi:hypothetical protein